MPTPLVKEPAPLDIGKIAWRAKAKITCAIPDDNGTYRDVYIRRVSRRAGIATLCELQDIDNKERFFTRPLKHCIAPLVPDINTRFAYMENLIEIAIEGGIKALFISGEGGIGKSYIVENTLDRLELEYGEDYALIKGHSTPRATYQLLHKYQDKVVIFDDCDSVLTSPQTESIMKAVLDAWATRRTVSWLTTRKDSEVLRSFEFTGTIIFVSNLNRNRIDKAMLSRCVVMDMEMTVEEKIERLQGLLYTIKHKADSNQRRQVFRLIKQFRYNILDLNVRTLLKALTVYVQTNNLDLVRYQILQ